MAEWQAKMMMANKDIVIDDVENDDKISGGKWKKTAARHVLRECGSKSHSFSMGTKSQDF